MPRRTASAEKCAPGGTSNVRMIRMLSVNVFPSTEMRPTAREISSVAVESLAPASGMAGGGVALVVSAKPDAGGGVLVVSAKPEGGGGVGAVGRGRERRDA